MNVGEWDGYVALAEHHNWTPDVVDRLDPDFILELLTFHDARGDHLEAERERIKRELEHGR